MSKEKTVNKEALGLMLKYLEDRYAEQIASLRDVDSKVKIRLTIQGALLGLVTLALRPLSEAIIPLAVFVGAVGTMVVFAACLFRALWLALSVLDVSVDLPGFDQKSFREAARHPELASEPVLRDFVANYTAAIAGNSQLILERNPPGDKLKWWSKATAAAAFVAVAYSGVVYVASAKDATPYDEVNMSKEESKPPADVSPRPAEQPAPTAQPSLEARPQHIELGKSHDSKGETRPSPKPTEERSK